MSITFHSKNFSTEYTVEINSDSTSLELRLADELGVDFIATGHYARIIYNKKDKKYSLKTGIDSKKDQSYVLYMLDQKSLKRTLMPLGNLTKQEVRKIAKRKKLPVADKEESQEICFIEDNNYGNFVKKYFPSAFIPIAGKPL